MHPSLPQPAIASGSGGRHDDDDDEAINSDLDDSDSDNERDDIGGAGADIVFCTYDKVCYHFHHDSEVDTDASQVARVKNKWKCILKDGMIHINGKDYLFAKCTGYV